MSIRIRSRRSLSIFVFAPALISTMALGCSGDESSVESHENVGGESDELLNRASPPRGPSTTSAAMGPVGSSTYVQTKSDGSTLSLNGSVVWASMSDGRDLTGGAITDKEAWISTGYGNSLSSAPNFDATLRATADHAASHQSELESGAVAGLISWLGKLGGGVTSSIGETTTDFTGYAPERARWLSSSLGTTIYGYPPKTGYYDQSYPEPAAFGEIDERGARLYCAAREAQRRQAGGSTLVGSLPAASFSVLGKKIDLLVVEPTTVLNGPVKIAEAAGRDGQQAFEIPMLFGTRITPIRGIGLSAMDEMRYPVVLSTADSEVENQADLTWVKSGLSFEQRAKKTYRTITHVDAITSASKHMEAKKRFDFIHSPVVDLGLELTLTADVGQIERANDRAISTPYANMSGTWPWNTRTGGDVYNPLGSVAYNDGYWTFDPGVAGEIGHRPPGWDVFPRVGPSTHLATDALSIPMYARLNADDDHHIATKSALGLNADVKGSAKYPVVGPFSIGVEGNIGIHGSVEQRHEVLDAVQVQRLWGSYNMPAAGITVRPRTMGDFNVGGSVGIIFSVSLPIVGTISRTLTLLNIPAKSLAHFDTDKSQSWPETASLRMGTASSWGDATQGSIVASHVPNGNDYGSFDSANVEACLADATPNPPPPPACGAPPTEGAPIETNICVVKPVSGNFDVCSNRGWYVSAEASTPAQTQCLQHYYDFLCEPVQDTRLSGSPLYGSTGHVSHLTRVDDPATMSRLADIQNECVAAFVDLSGDDAARKAKTKAYLDQQFTFAVCDSAAVPAPGATLTLDPPSTPVGTTPPVEPSAPCN